MGAAGSHSSSEVEVVPWWCATMRVRKDGRVRAEGVFPLLRSSVRWGARGWSVGGRLLRRGFGRRARSSISQQSSGFIISQQLVWSHIPQFSLSPTVIGTRKIIHWAPVETFACICRI
ncbi:uncharacterized protein LOC133887064 isoform X1 [Phragmites australis]|uniref:uncharacterized protein LOC133887064 isoform X1 n=1 Tax=Phragmites australis TaxID=29695 RepID=UPI002D766877|nr:uncharacterized protein LOC133887064 isoform X1 [Phragmites australis]